MSITTRVRDGVRILDMSGDFAVGRHLGQPVDLKGHRLEDLGEMIGALLDGGISKIVLNLAKVRFIDSAGLGQLIACRKRTLDRGGDIKLLNPGKQVHEVLVMTLLADVFEIHTDEDEAVAAFTTPRSPLKNTLIGLMAVVLLGGCGSSRMIDSPSAGAPGTSESPRAAEAHDAAALPPATPASGDSETPPKEHAAPAPAPADAAQQASSPVDFETQIRPILERCQPCHFEGGKMYAQLPFDTPKTVRTLGEKLFTRIQDPDEQATIRAFLAQPEDSGPSGQ